MRIIEEKIKIYPDSVLRKKSIKLDTIGEKEQEFFDSMALIMEQNQGVGLAAPQIGRNIQMIVASNGTDIFKIANPKIIEKKGASILEEGCLSIPGVTIKVKRAKKVIVEGLDHFSRSIKIEADGLLSHILQHEIDHLIGKLIIDYASFRERIRIFEILQSLKRQYACGLTKSCPPKL
ncbi:MAG: peptide deformylase [Candidatus Omnitrophota bacterium]